MSIVDVTKILNSTKQDPKLAEVFLQYSDGNTRRLEHLICNSISVAELNGNIEVDEAIVRETSKMLMDRE